MQLLRDVLDNFIATAIRLNGIASSCGSADQKSLKEGLPRFFQDLLNEQGRAHEFKVEGSYGNGNMALVPWVAIFNRAVTETAQDGYYIVLLFSQDMTTCHLSLNQGVTSFEQRYSRGLAMYKIKVAAQRALRYFEPDPFAIVGPIQLNATANLGKGYQQGAIESFRYEKSSLPDSFEMATHFFRLLEHYDRLVPVVSTTLQALVPVNESEFQQVSMEKAASTEFSKKYDEPTRAVPIPTPGLKTKSVWKRDVRVAACALRKANFRCAIDPTHQTFLSSAGQHPYVEAHHLVPISQQESFSYSLDVPANVVALCASCHRLLHHGRYVDKKIHLRYLYVEREPLLRLFQIRPEMNTLLGYYSRELLSDE